MAWKTTYYPIPPRPICTPENSTHSGTTTIKTTVHCWTDEIPDIDRAIQAWWSHQDEMREKRASLAAARELAANEPAARRAFSWALCPLQTGPMNA